MPLTTKGKEVLENMEKEYGAKKGESVFYASANKGTITGVHDNAPSSEGSLPSVVTLADINAANLKLWGGN